MRRSWVGTCAAVVVAGCVDEPTGPSGSLLEPPRPSAVLVYGPVVTLKNVTQLQPLPGAGSVQPTAVNRSGQVVGTSDLRPVIWEEGVPRELPVPAGFGQTDATGISDDGRIFGLAREGAVMWEDGEAREFTAFPGHTETRGRINSAGIVVGSSFPPGGTERVTWVWDDGVATLLPPAEGFQGATAVYANATGMALGSSTNDGQVHSTTIWQDGRVIDVIEGTPSPPDYLPTGISDVGDAFFYHRDERHTIYRWRAGTADVFPDGEGSGSDREVIAVSPDGTLLMEWEGDVGVWVDDEFRPLDPGTVSACEALALDAWVVCWSPERGWFVAQLDLDGTSSRSVTDLGVDGVTASSVTLSWTQVDDGTGAPASYRLKYAGPPIDWRTATIGCARTMSGTAIGAPMSCTVEGLEEQTDYEFQLMSFRTEDGVWVDAKSSNIAAASTSGSGPDRVDDLRVSAVTESSITVRWTQIDDGTGNPARYRVKYAEPSISYATATRACTIRGEEIGAELSCTITDLDPGTTYEIQLKSYRLEDGLWADAVESNVVTATTDGSSDERVDDLRVTAVTARSITVRWTQIDDGTGNPARYRVKYAEPPISYVTATRACTIRGEEIGEELSCTITDLDPGTAYEVQLRSYRLEDGLWVNAVASNVASATTATQ